MSHRGDIQGLRAGAILLVVGAHAQVPGLSSGFVGVDVFFVLSGYLITRLLTAELSAKGSIDLAVFYARRFCRLLPALVLVVVASLGLAVLVLPDIQLLAQTRSAAWAVAWLSNFHFVFADTDYFDTESGLDWFLHTWSLGVEEQFYLLWPALLLAAQLGRHSSPSLSRYRWTMGAIFVCSLGACVAISQRSPTVAFYMMPLRAWQFALGALIVLRGSAGSASAPELAGAKYAGIAGLMLIAGSAVFVPSDSIYPGAWALLPSIGAFLVILSGEFRPEKGAGALLSLPAMQWIGNLSYSWYLWHWPLLQFGAALGVATLSGRCALAVVALMMAFATYQWLEKPIRKNRSLVAEPRWAIIGALALMIVINATAIRWSQRLRDTPFSAEDKRYFNDATLVTSPYRLGCDDWYKSAAVKLCAFGAEDATHTAIAMGDSVGLQWFPALSDLFEKPGWRLIVITKASCPMVDESFFYRRIGRDFVECQMWRDAALMQVAQLRPDILILGSTSGYPFGREQWTEGTKRVLTAVAPSAGKIYVMRATPILPFDGPACLTNHSPLYSALHASSDRCTAANVDAHADDVFSWITEATRSFANVTVVDMTDAVCPGTKCHAMRDGVVVYRDKQHIAAGFARALSGTLAERFGLTP